MDGRYVFKMATTRMMEVAQEVLERNGVSVGDLSLVLMHQANKRINEYCQKALGLPDEKVAHNIERYGNTTAATIPLLWDECARAGRLKPGDLVLMVAFGAGMSWGATPGAGLTRMATCSSLWALLLAAGPAQRASAARGSGRGAPRARRPPASSRCPTGRTRERASR